MEAFPAQIKKKHLKKVRSNHRNTFRWIGYVCKQKHCYMTQAHLQIFSYKCLVMEIVIYSFS